MIFVHSFAFSMDHSTASVILNFEYITRGIELQAADQTRKKLKIPIFRFLLGSRSGCANAAFAVMLASTGRLEDLCTSALHGVK